MNREGACIPIGTPMIGDRLKGKDVGSLRLLLSGRLFFGPTLDQIRTVFAYSQAGPVLALGMRNREFGFATPCGKQFALP